MLMHRYYWPICRSPDSVCYGGGKGGSRKLGHGRCRVGVGGWWTVTTCAQNNNGGKNKVG